MRRGAALGWRLGLLHLAANSCACRFPARRLPECFFRAGRGVSAAPEGGATAPPAQEPLLPGAGKGGGALFAEGVCRAVQEVFVHSGAPLRAGCAFCGAAEEAGLLKAERDSAAGCSNAAVRPAVVALGCRRAQRCKASLPELLSASFQEFQNKNIITYCRKNMTVDIL